ncbi:TPA: hypothetical protein I8385_001460 [Citrobacter freundii]|uniref:Uncharacterized protein n=1 Tax=Citrobacter freundii TaxID=546 RepID=A0ABD7B1A1_CITFR|nr:hypothetical protein [Citrobacter freundii]POV64342.1 hypothetical protein C3404_09520 [Citrobacter freundii complex sp. CFNIH11]ASJ98776.1 hypothetical protein CFA70_00150 [Citrobacter freundii]EIX7372216.1 hypothetical protein [Citrobacter freundii]EKU2551415.1 hypothetical protein [Citrobacter freundii]EKU3698714.1 hypothetical protein [Citrobacter freundii]
MKKTEMTVAEAKRLVAEMFANGKNPMEQFGITWEEAESIERNNPGLTLKCPEEPLRLYAY